MNNLDYPTLGSCNNYQNCDNQCHDENGYRSDYGFLSFSYDFQTNNDQNMGGCSKNNNLKHNKETSIFIDQDVQINDECHQEYNDGHHRLSDTNFDPVSDVFNTNIEENDDAYTNKSNELKPDEEIYENTISTSNNHKTNEDIYTNTSNTPMTNGHYYPTAPHKLKTNEDNNIITNENKQKSGDEIIEYSESVSSSITIKDECSENLEHNDVNWSSKCLSCTEKVSPVHTNVPNHSDISSRVKEIRDSIALGKGKSTNTTNSLETALHDVLDKFEKDFTNRCECSAKSGKIGVSPPCFHCSSADNSSDDGSDTISIKSSPNSIENNNLDSEIKHKSSIDYPFLQARHPNFKNGIRSAIKEARRNALLEMESKKQSKKDVEIKIIESDDVVNGPKISPTAAFFCNYRIPKFVICLPLAIIVTFFLLGVPFTSTSFFNYTAVFAIFVFYPLSCVIGMVFDKIKPRIASTINNCRKRFTKNKQSKPLKPKVTPGPETRFKSRRPSYARRVSVCSNLPTITEDKVDEEEMTKARDKLEALKKMKKSDEEVEDEHLEPDEGFNSNEEAACEDNEQEEMKELYKPCDQCLQKNLLNICTHENNT